jgi:protein-S-isoprenylcysteine O-methyltransferase Ste14
LKTHSQAIKQSRLSTQGFINDYRKLIFSLLATISSGGHKDKKVMQTELYSICRNPLYFASFLMAVGVGLLTGRVDFLLLITVAYLAIFYPMTLNEAKYLTGRF